MSAAAALSFRSFAVGSLHWQLRFFPCFPTAGNIPKIVKSFWLQNTRGEAGPITASAINHRRLATIEFANSFAQLWEKNMACARDSSFFPFARRTYIENLKRGITLVKLMHAHLSDSFERV